LVVFVFEAEDGIGAELVTGVQTCALPILEDVESDAELAERELKRAGLAVRVRRVEREEDFRREVGEFRPHVILSDFSMPQFNGRSEERRVGKESATHRAAERENNEPRNRR